MNIIAVMGGAGSGKSTFSTIGTLYQWNTEQVGVGLKKIDKYIYKTFTDIPSLTETFINNPVEILESGVVTSSLSQEQIKVMKDWFEEIKMFYPKMYFRDFINIVSEGLNWYNNTPIIVHNGKRRNALQYIGTYMRDKYSPDIHIDGVVNYIYQTNYQNWVISSVRYLNEIEALQRASQSFKVVLINGSREPLTEEASQHPSETEWKSWITNHPGEYIIIDNDSTLHNFIIKCSNYFGGLNANSD